MSLLVTCREAPVPLSARHRLREESAESRVNPIDCRSLYCIAVWDRTLALGYSKGRVSILGFKEGLKRYDTG